MPKRKDLKKILVVGAGPIIIGQACEFDYSGTQACKALKDEGYKVVLINSNPATIMTDPDVADKTYIEPITLDVLEKILKKEKPDAILPTMGGQTALNLASDLPPGVRPAPSRDRQGPQATPENVVKRASSLAEQAFVMSATGWGPFAGSRDFFREIATATWLEI